MAMLSAFTTGLLPLPDLVLVCSWRSIAEGAWFPRLVSLAFRRRCRSAGGNDLRGEEGDSNERFERGGVRRAILRGAGEGDAEGVEIDDKGR